MAFWDSRGDRPRLVTPVFLLVMAATFAYFTAIGALIPILPRYVEGPLSGGNVAVGFVMGSFALSAVILRPFAGRLSDSRGRRLLVVAGAWGAGLSVLTYIPANSVAAMIALRVITGIGEALFYVGVASVINDIAPDERRGEALSYFSLALFGGLAAGPVLGETALNAGGFDAAWAVAAISAGISGAVGLAIPETRPPTEEPDPDAAPITGWRRVAHPAAIGPGLVLAASIWGLATFTSFIPLYVLTLGMGGSRGLLAFHSGIVFAIRAFGARIPDRLGPGRTARAALSCSVVGFAVIAMWPSVTGLFVGAAIYSVGHSLAFPALMTVALAGTRASERGAVIGTFTAFFDLSFGVGAVSAGGIAAALGYRGAFAGASVVAGAGLIFLAVRSHNRRRAGTPNVVAPETHAAPRAP